MSGRERNDEKEREDGGGGWASTFWKVASAAAATAVVAGGLYSVLKQPEAEQVAVSTVWTKPMVGWMKLNVDGSLLPKSAGCGGVLRDHSGKWVKGFAQKLDSSLKEDQTEREAILRGLKWAKDQKDVIIRKVVVESDNEGIVYKVNNVKKETKSNDPYILAIWELLRSSSDWEARLIPIPRSANNVADKLAGFASKTLTSFDLQEYDDPHPNCIQDLAKDSPHLYTL